MHLIVLPDHEQLELRIFLLKKEIETTEILKNMTIEEKVNLDHLILE